MLERKSDFEWLAFSATIFAVCSCAVPLLQHLIQAFAFGDVACGGEHALQPSISIVEGGRIVGNHGLATVPASCRQLVVGNLAYRENPLDAGLGQVGIGEVVLESRADQFIARTACQGLHLLVDVGDDALRIGGHQSVDVGFDE